jgi:hypothetical protein
MEDTVRVSDPYSLPVPVYVDVTADPDGPGQKFEKLFFKSG